MTTKKIVTICIGILLVAAAVTFLVFNTEPTANSEGATRKTAMLVEVVKVERGDYEPEINATGTVQPVEDVILSPLVGGQIIDRSPAFTPGGFVEKGTVLLQIDPADYRNALQLRKSDLLEARTNLEMEMGRQEVAEQDLELIGADSLSEQQRSLVLRKPQLNAIKATVEAAEAAVNQEQLNLARTTIRAPFDAHILSQNVTVGSHVTPGDNLGRLVGSEHYWVLLTVPVDKLQWLNFPDNADEKGTIARIRNTGWPQNVFRMGYLDSQIGALDEQTRLARVLVRVPDPLALTKDDKPKLMIGGFVEAQLKAREVEDVVRLNRDFLRRNQTVWVMKDGKLEIREVDIVLMDSQYAYVKKGLEDDEQVVTTNLSTVAEGIELRNESNDSISGSANKQNQASEE